MAMRLVFYRGKDPPTVIAVGDGESHDILHQNPKGIRVLHDHPLVLTFYPNICTIVVKDPRNDLPVGKIEVKVVPGTWKGLVGMDAAGAFIECQVVDITVGEVGEEPEAH